MSHHALARGVSVSSQRSHRDQPPLFDQPAEKLRDAKDNFPTSMPSKSNYHAVNPARGTAVAQIWSMDLALKAISDSRTTMYSSSSAFDFSLRALPENLGSMAWAR
jgi:hypothetical protein